MISGKPITGFVIILLRYLKLLLFCILIIFKGLYVMDKLVNSESFFFFFFFFFVLGYYEKFISGTTTIGMTSSWGSCSSSCDFQLFLKNY